MRCFLLLVLSFHASASMASEEGAQFETAKLVVVNKTGKNIQALRVGCKVSRVGSDYRQADWKTTFDIGALEKEARTVKYEVKYPKDSHWKSNFWSIRASFEDGFGIATDWYGSTPREGWKRCNFPKKVGPNSQILINLQENGEVTYQISSGANSGNSARILCEQSLELYRPVSPLKEVYSISHMTNTVGAIKWAVQHRANAVEADLDFTRKGKNGNFNLKFRHGNISDCLPIKFQRSICHIVNGASAEDPIAWFNQIRTSKLPLVIIDSKLKSITEEADLKAAGTQVAKLLHVNLFKQGYQGSVIVAVPKIEQVPYLVSVLEQAKKLDNSAEKLYFTIDQEGGKFSQVLSALLPLKPNIVYGTGISANLQYFDSKEMKTYYNGITEAVEARNKGTIKFIYIWTLDKKSSMKRYLRAGVDGVMTNEPGVLADIITRFGKAQVFSPAEKKTMRQNPASDLNDLILATTFDPPSKQLTEGGQSSAVPLKEECECECESESHQ